MFDAALERMLGELDDVEGSSAMSHSADECPDPLGCTAHDDEHGDNLSPLGDKPAGDGVTIEVKKMGLPSLDGAKEPSLDDKGQDGEGLSDEDADILKKLLGK